jgi:hypothetical protein
MSKKYSIVDVLSVDDATSEYEKIIGRKSLYKVLKVSCTIKTVDGRMFEKTEYFMEPVWEDIKRIGSYEAYEDLYG